MNKTFFLRGVSVVGVLSLLGAGCNPFAPVRDRVADEVGEAAVERMVESGFGGNANVELGGKIPSDFPSDIPRYPGAEYLSAVVMQEGSIAIANFTTDDSPEEVVAWFEAEVAANGYASDEGMAKLGLFRIFKKGEATITLQTQARDGRTYVTVQRAEKK